MTSSQQVLVPRSTTTPTTINEILGALVARYRSDEVLTSIRQIPAREAEFRPVPAWVRSELSKAYRAKGIKALYSHQAATAERVRSGRNVVVVTPTASGKTLCYNLPVLNAVLENPDIRALYLFPTKAHHALHRADSPHHPFVWVSGECARA
jgi:DEAD/DEAH box helicase domain-containing protein